MTMKSFIKRDPIFTRKPFAIFTVIVMVSLAQIFWWIFFQVSQNEDVYRLHQADLTVQSQQAAFEVEQSCRSLLMERNPNGNPGFLNTIHDLPQLLIPEVIRSGNNDVFYCSGDTIYYKSVTGAVSRSAIRWDALQVWFDGSHPDFVIHPVPQAQTYRQGPAHSLVLPVRITPKTERVRELTDRTKRKTIMFISEGAFFSLMIMVGIYVMYSTLKKELVIQAQQNNFILSITHELKSPLASVKLYLQTLMDKDVPEEKRKQFLRHSLDDTERLERLVENVLEAARLEQKGYGYVLEAVELSALVNRSLERVRYYADDESVELKTEIEKELAVRGDVHSLVSVFDNLIENAVKYSRTPKQIRVHLKKEGRNARFEIQDNGMGISEEDLPFVFERFYRAGNEMTRGTKGTGLGLYVVKKIVEIHHGSVGVESGGAHAGAKFTVTFPLILK